MRILTLEQAIGHIGTQVRTHFTNLMEKREEMFDEFNLNRSVLATYVADNWEDLPIGFLALEYKDMIFIIRKRARDFFWITDYDTNHLRNSLIANILLDETLSMKDRLDRIVYIYYYYWFLRKRDETTIDNITHNVCFELQEIIKLLIQKELSVYRNYNTVELVNAVRWRLASENLLLMARTSSINFRRNT